ncbi:MAG: CPBP family intramembrane glutamic endopeptidase [Arthrobacter sp.]|nr:CPBP family intramembrane glutamic endopeptidase [Arthrobacter sp.]MDZ4351485.1 CPBP family intramembrane glutamic endopeptidase [Arthrobacter sp.]
MRIFFIATILWTWTVGLVFVMVGLNETALGEIVFLFSAGVAPSAVGLFMVFSTYTRQARGDYFKRFIPTWRGAWFVLLYATLLLGLSTAVLVGFFGELPDFNTVKGFISNPLTILTFVFFLYMWGPLNEEFGWRGYALDKMLIRHGFIKGSLMLGFIWGIWHLPWIFFAGQWQARAFQVSPWWFVVYVAQCMLFSLVISIAYMLSNRSYFTAATVHGVGNATVGLIYFEVSLSGTIWYAVTAIGVSMVIIAATFGLFGRRFKAKRAEQIGQIHRDREKFSMNAVYSM